MKTGKKIFNLERQYVSYGTYHRHPVNVGLHIFCIDLLLFCVQLIIAQCTPYINGFLFAGQLEHPLLFQLNWAFLPAFVMSGWFISLEPIAGTLTSAKIIAATAVSGMLVTDDFEFCGQSVLWIVMAIIIACLVLLEIGHKFFEERSPAVIAKSDETFLTAPLFVVLQVLFYLGYKKELYEQLKKQIEANVAALDQK